VSGVRLGPGGEFDRIRRFLRAAPDLPPGVRVGPGDDAAVLEPDLVVSVDLAVEGVHFRLDWITPAEAGARAAAGAMSDLAAMAARPLGVLASLGAGGEPRAAEAFMDGLRSRVEALGGVLLGGDLVRSPGVLFVDVIAVGRTVRPLLRSGARVRDELWVTGVLGGAAAAVALWERGERPPPALREAFVRPEPRIHPALWLMERGARAGLDLSDGLAGDAGHLAAASGVGIRLYADRVPVHAGLADAAEGLDPLALALHGGEDYELLVALPPGALPPRRVEEFRERFDLPLSPVGEAVPGEGVFLVPPGGGSARPLARGGYDHFGEGGER
jgi:thiamine-monophosphate kinase